MRGKDGGECKNSEGDEKKIEITDINRGQRHHSDREIRVNNLFILPLIVEH